jgi:Ni/Fe-hydrogenase subunit HybB-like protein
VKPYEHAEPVGGKILTPSFLVLLALAGLAGVLIVWRFAVGLGATTALNDGYPWGLWIAFDVVTGTALACGGYAMALLVYIMNRGEYQALVRPALVTSALGYSIAGFSVLIDIGRPWLGWKLPLFWMWNTRSVLLEVALCIMAYTIVVWIELAPAFLQRATTSTIPRLQHFSGRVLPKVTKSLTWIIALALLLPTMHQSSLGSLMLLAGPRLHPLWNTPILPLLFLICCIFMGFGAVVVESSLCSKMLGRKSEREMLSRLAGIIVPTFGLFLLVRLTDLIVRGQLPALFRLDLYSVMSLVEWALAIAAFLLLWSKRRRRNLGNLFIAAMLLLLYGGIYRFDVYLVAFRPGAQWSYFPSVTEILITAGLVAGEIAAYIALIKTFPILTGSPKTVIAKPRPVIQQSYAAGD